MADSNVNIVGAEPGILKTMAEGLPPWATQKTLEDIQKILKDTYNLNKNLVSGTPGKSSAGSAIGDLDDVILSTSRDIRKRNEEDKLFHKDKSAEHKKSSKNWKEITSLQTAYNTVLARSSLLIRQSFIDSFKVYDSLNQAGILVASNLETASSGINALQQITQITGVRFTELNQIIQKYGQAVNVFSTGKFAKTLSSSVQSLTAFGFSSKEAADLLGAYINAQIGYNDISKKSIEDTSQRLTKFGERIFRLSMATGLARNAILANVEALSKSIDATILYQQAGDAATETTLSFLAGLKNQNFARDFLRLMTDTIKPLNTTFMAFQKIGLGGFAQKIVAFQNSLKGLSPEQQQQAMKAFRDRNKFEIDAAVRSANLYRQIPELSGEASTVLDFVTGLNQAANSIKELNEDEIKKQMETNKAVSGLKTQWEKLLSSIQAAFVPTIPMINFLTTVLEGINKTISYASNLIDDATKSWIGVGVMAAAALKGATWIGSLFSSLPKLSSFATSLGSILGVITKWLGGIVAAFSVGFTIGTIFDNWVRSIGGYPEIITDIFDAIFGTFHKFIDILGAVFSTEIYQIPEIISGFVKNFATSLFDLIKKIGEVVPSVIKGVVPNFLKPLFSKSENIAGVSAKEQIPIINEIRTGTIKEPVQSTLDSPSQVSSKKSVNPEAPSLDVSKPSAIGIEKPAGETSINSMLGYQNALIEQLVQSTNSMLSVNKDILRYSRIST